MKTRFWKRACLTLPLAMLAAHVATPRTMFAQAVTETTVFADDAGDIFGTNLPTAQPVSTSGPCTDPVAPHCLPAQPGSEIPSYSPPATSNPDAVFSNPAPLGSLPSGQGALTAQNLVAAANMGGGYLDSAAPITTFRVRYDIANDNAFADRGEYIYAQSGTGNIGPAGNQQSVSFEEIRAYVEIAPSDRFSFFLDTPYRFASYTLTPTSPPGQGDTDGFGDLNAGFKYAFIAEQDEYFTFQFRTYIPTGDGSRGLGTDHVSIEPSLLYFKRLSNRWFLQTQLTDHQPIDVSSYASNVLQYGAGLSYLMFQGDAVSVMPTFEVVGWTFLGGSKFNENFNATPVSASGDTIVNIKPGVRIGLGEAAGPLSMPNHSIYAGFGIPITNEKFYNDLFRLEYRILF